MSALREMKIIFDYAAIGERVRTMRLRRRISQAELARRAGVVPNTILGCEQGRKTRGDKLVAIARGLGVENVEVLLSGDDILNPRYRDLNADDLEIALLYHHATNRQRKAIELVARASKIDPLIVIVEKHELLDERMRGDVKTFVERVSRKPEAPRREETKARR